MLSKFTNYLIYRLDGMTFQYSTFDENINLPNLIQENCNTSYIQVQNLGAVYSTFTSFAKVIINYSMGYNTVSSLKRIMHSNPSDKQNFV